MTENEKVIVKEIVRVEENPLVKAEVVGPVEAHVTEGTGYIIFLLGIQIGIMLYIAYMLNNGLTIFF